MLSLTEYGKMGFGSEIDPAIVKFTGNTSLKIDLSGIDTSSISDMSSMFSNCSNVIKLDVRNFDTSSATTMNKMFNNCENVVALDVSRFDTSNVTDFTNMFYRCNKLTNLDLSSFDTSHVTKFDQMLDCPKLETVTFGDDFVCDAATSLFGLFMGSKKLIAVDLPNFTVTGNNCSAYSMFSNCENIESIDLSNFNTSKIKSFEAMFNNCKSLVDLSIGTNFVDTVATTTTSMFNGCAGIKEIRIPNFTKSLGNKSFYGCTSLEVLDISGITSQAVASGSNCQFGNPSTPSTQVPATCDIYVNNDNVKNAILAVCSWFGTGDNIHVGAPS